jgi:hypothetical protein
MHSPFKPSTVVRNYVPPVGIAAILLASLSPEPVLVTGLILAALVTVGLVERAREPAHVGPEAVATD